MRQPGNALRRVKRPRTQSAKFKPTEDEFHVVDDQIGCAARDCLLIATEVPESGTHETFPFSSFFAVLVLGILYGCAPPSNKGIAYAFTWSSRKLRVRHGG